MQVARILKNPEVVPQGVTAVPDGPGVSFSFLQSADGLWKTFSERYDLLVEISFIPKEILPSAGN